MTQRSSISEIEGAPPGVVPRIGAETVIRQSKMETLCQRRKIAYLAFLARFGRTEQLREVEGLGKGEKCEGHGKYRCWIRYALADDRRLCQRRKIAYLAFVARFDGRSSFGTVTGGRKMRAPDFLLHFAVVSDERPQMDQHFVKEKLRTWLLWQAAVERGGFGIVRGWSRRKMRAPDFCRISPLHPLSARR